MKKVLAIYSCPQECGDQMLDFISLETGQIIKEINMEGWSTYHCYVRKKTKKGIERTLTYIQGPFDPGKELDLKVGAERDVYQGNSYRVVRKIEWEDAPDWGEGVRFVRITEDEGDYKYDTVYDPSLDEFNNYLKSIGIDIPYDSDIRQDVIGKLIPLIAEIYGYEIVNLLQY